MASLMIKSSAFKFELFSALAIAERRVLPSIRAAFLGMNFKMDTPSVAFFPGRIRATSLAFLGEILMYLEYDLISIVYFCV